MEDNFCVSDEIKKDKEDAQARGFHDPYYYRHQPLAISTKDLQKALKKIRLKDWVRSFYRKRVKT